jgi:hypothetical protein
MQPKDKIGKAAWNQMQAMRDSVVKDVADAIRDGKVEAATAQQLLNLISASIEAGYHKGFSVFDKEVDAALGEAAKDHRPTTKKK